jgi:glycosyltransferase involved in cell wall biosynthesis
MKNTVSAILSGYRRPHALQEQYNSVKDQTIKPNEILFWKNHYQVDNFNQDIINNCISAISNNNFGVWARFAYALNCKSKYICIIDDDTIPGSRWLENCINSFEEKPGLYGTIGLIYKSSETYMGAQRVGWDGINNDEIMEVDIVGHAWFFSREMLSLFWREMPDPNDKFVGEDMHFSYMLQKYSDMKTYVPPHPVSDKSLWGSLHGFKYGADHNATGNFAVPMMDEYFKKIVKTGFKVINS